MDARRKFLLFITEDWFALSHFSALIARLSTLGETVVATNPSGRRTELEALGARVVDVDFLRSDLRPWRQWALARRLSRLIGEERPDVLHAISMQVSVVTSLALRLGPRPRGQIFHITGLGFLGISNGLVAEAVRRPAFALLAREFTRAETRVIAENPDDVADLAAKGVRARAPVVIVGGAGVDETRFPALPPPGNDPPVAAFLGRMVRAKGVDVLVAAVRLARARGVPLDLALYGGLDPSARDGFTEDDVAAWTREPGIRWHGRVSDIKGVWARSDICVLPALTREGLPRAVLEAAACARPLVVTDVPGCRHVVREGQEGLIVPPGNASVLSDALAKLAGDPALRLRLGAAARERILSGFTVDQVCEAILGVYQDVLAGSH